MKAFIIKVVCFVFPIICLVIAFEWLLRSIPNNYAYKSHFMSSNLAKSTQILIIGNSHSYRGVNPKYFNQVTFNASHVSQSINFNHHILEKKLNHLSNVTHIIMPISYSSLYAKLNNERNGWRIKNYIIYYNIITLPFNLSNCFEFSTGKISKNIIRLIKYYKNKKSDLSCLENGFTAKEKKTTPNFIEDGEKAAKRHTYKDKKHLEENLVHLESIKNLCKEQNIKLLLFIPPAWETYRGHIDKAQMQETITYCELFSKKNENVLFLNLFDNPNFKKMDFSDSDHLNNSGAQKLSTILNNTINQ